MRKTYHLCLSSHDEPMFRSEEDFVYGFNFFAESVLETESRALADGELTSHEHFGVCSDCPDECMSRTRYRQTRYFNAKYRRTGPLGEKKHFCSEVDGIRHETAMLSYVMRQGLHHGMSSTPFGYPHCSSNALFRDELGKKPDTDLMPESQRRKYLSRNSPVGSSYRMSRSGLLLREDVIDVQYVEEIFVSARNFLFCMNRRSGTDWVQEQEDEKSSGPAVTLDLIEKGVPDAPLDLLQNNENGRVDKSRITDLELCRRIDRELVPEITGKTELTGREVVSVYLLEMQQRRELGNRLWKESRAGLFPYVTEQQLRRCLVIK